MPEIVRSRAGRVSLVADGRLEVAVVTVDPGLVVVTDVHQVLGEPRRDSAEEPVEVGWVGGSEPKHCLDVVELRLAAQGVSDDEALPLLDPGLHVLLRPRVFLVLIAPESDGHAPHGGVVEVTVGAKRRHNAGENRVLHASCAHPLEDSSAERFWDLSNHKEYLH